MSELPLFIGIDTSNYTTSCAVCDSEGTILLNHKRLLFVDTARRGLRQSDAVFAHTKNLPDLLPSLRPFTEGRRVAAVGVSAKPRDAEDSYMPCFLTGIVAAEALSAGLSVPLFRFSHQQGHIRVAFETSGALSVIGDGSFLSFHVSGGTTEILLVNQTEDGMQVQLVGGTADLNAGQAIDRTGVAMGLQFPCGPAMEREALLYDGPKAKLSVNGTACNLSGLENQALKLYKDGASVGAVSAFVFHYLAALLLRLTQNARAVCGNLPVVYAGGVMSNSVIRDTLSAQENVYFTQPEYSADNAAGIALLCRYRFMHDTH